MNLVSFIASGNRLMNDNLVGPKNTWREERRSQDSSEESDVGTHSGGESPSFKKPHP